MSLRERLRTTLARTSIRRQLSLAAAAVVSLTALVSASIMVLGEYHATRRAVLADLQVQARMIAANSSATLVFDDAAAAQEILAALRASEDVSAARLIRADGRVLAEYRGESRPAFGIEQLRLNEPVRYLGRDYGRLEIDAHLRRLYSRLMLYSAGALTMLLLAVAMALSLFSWLVRFITQPVNELTALMRQVARDGDYSRRSGIDSDNEIGDIARGFDAMLGEIEQRQRALTHELQERRRTQSELDYLARHDSLTRLGNRHALAERMQEAEQQCASSHQQCALLLLDLDNFKMVNDSLGHHAGDGLLVQFAARLSAHIGDQAGIYRLGGDEFALVLQGGELEPRCQALAARIVALTRESFGIDGHEVFATVSAGCALYPQHASKVDRLLRRADLALYAAKNQGRDTWRMFSRDMQERAEQRLHLESDLRRALERQEFFLVYEPQIDLRNGRLCGVEALLRWRHPQRGVVGPVDFIPLAEETGLIVAIGGWVLRQACRDGAQLLALGLEPGFRLAINLAPRQLSEAGLVDAVAQALSETGFDASHLEFEVTESVMTEHIERVAERMQAIAAFGVSFAMDDFGAGASSLSYLRRLPLTKLKIDRSFVKDIPGSHGDCEIAAAIIAIGSRLGLKVLAEGVETAEQLAFLCSQGCDLGQGYHFARPQLLEDFLADWRQRLGRPPPATAPASPEPSLRRA